MSFVQNFQVKNIFLCIANMLTRIYVLVDANNRKHTSLNSYEKVDNGEGVKWPKNRMTSIVNEP